MASGMANDGIEIYYEEETPCSEERKQTNANQKCELINVNGEDCLKLIDAYEKASIETQKQEQQQQEQQQQEITPPPKEYTPVDPGEGAKIDDKKMTCEEILGKVGTSFVKGAITVVQIIGVIITLIKAMTLLIPAVAAKDAEALKKASGALVSLGVILLLLLLLKPLVTLLGKLLELDVSCII